MNRLGLGVVALTVSIVGISIRRLVLYEQEFGLTMLRLFTTVFAGWLAVVFVVAAVQLLRRRGSLVASIAASAIVGLPVMNAVNPEAVVARRNLDRFGGSDRLDIVYLVDELGADAAPVLYDHPATRDVLCRRPAPDEDPPLTFNLSRHRARQSHELRC